jgi:CHAD domain-containing protein
MPYRIKRAEAIPKAVRRIAMEQIERARNELRGEDLEAAEAVHQARKRFKKLRALLRLVRPAMKSKRYKAENRLFRDLGRRLAVARDNQVLLETLDALADAHNGEPGAEELSALRDVLVSRQEAQREGDGRDLDSRMIEVAAALDRYPARLEGWSLGARGFAALGPGLKRSYRQGRKAMRKARKTPGDAQFHEWRKRVKDHWYHSRLLQGQWAELMKPHARELKRLSDLLGDDHDLAVFRETVASLNASPLSDAGRRSLFTLVAQRQEQLRNAAHDLGARVYAESPKRFTQRWRAYWRAWRPADD